MIHRAERAVFPTLLIAVLTLGILSCGRDSTGPGSDATARLTLDPRFPAAFAVAGAGDVVPFNRVRVTLKALDGAVVLDRMIEFPADQESISLTLEVPFPPDAGPEGMPLLLLMRYINAQGDTVFRAGPLKVTAHPGRNSDVPPVESFDVEYVGVGSNAAIVLLSPEVSSVVAGSTTSFTVMAMDAQENPLPGTPIIFSTPDAASVQVSATGVATWLAEAGSARVIATVPTGTAADTLLVTVVPEGTARTIEWTGAMDSDWGNGGNWSTGTVPTRIDSVYIPSGTPAAPVLTVPNFVGELVMAPSATLSLGHQLEVHGSLDVQPGAAITYATEAANLVLAGDAGGTIRGALPGAHIADGPFTLAGDVVIAGSLTISGTLEIVSAVATALDVGGTLFIVGNGRLLSSGGNHTITVGGDALFEGGASNDDLQSGRLRVAGHLMQTAANAPGSLRTSPAFIVELTGDGVINFATPGQTTIGNLLITGANITRTLMSDVTVLNQLDLGGTGLVLQTPTAGQGGSHTITAPRVIVGASGVVLRNVALLAQDFQSGLGLTFTDFDPAVVQLDIAAGSGTSRMSNVTFATQPTGNGRYVQVTDTDGSSGSDVTLVVGSGMSPAFHGGFAEAIAPATLTGWLMPTFSWTGELSDIWIEPGNWSDDIVPATTDSVHIPATFNVPPQFPVNGVTVRAFVSDFTASDLLLDGPLTVTERFAVPMSTGVVCDGGSLTMAGVGTAVVSGRLNGCNVTAMSGTVAAANTLRIENGNLQIAESALFEVARQTVFVGANFSTLETGRIAMRTDIDSLIVMGDVLFGGGSTAGLLAAGVIEVGGNFTQDGRSSLSSFAATGSHVTRFVGAVPQSVTFSLLGPGSSHFGNLELAQQSVEAYVQLNSPAIALGMLRTDDRVASHQLRNVPAANLSVSFESRGADVVGVTFVDVTWTIFDGAPIGRMQDITFSAMNTEVIQLSMERDADDVFISGLTMGSLPRGGRYISLSDPRAGTLFRVTVERGSPATLSGLVEIAPPATLVWNGVPIG